MSPLLQSIHFFLTSIIGAIATKIYLAGGSTQLYRRIVFIIVESSALYALGVLTALVTFVSGTNGQYVAVDAIVPLVVSPNVFHLPFFFSGSNALITCALLLGHRILFHYAPNPH